jgi:hypothetical protein
MRLKDTEGPSSHRFNYFLLELKDYDKEISVRVKGSPVVMNGYIKDLIIADPQAPVSILVMKAGCADRYILVDEIVAITLRAKVDE